MKSRTALVKTFSLLRRDEGTGDHMATKEEKKKRRSADGAARSTDETRKGDSIHCGLSHKKETSSFSSVLLSVSSTDG